MVAPELRRRRLEQPGSVRGLAPARAPAPLAPLTARPRPAATDVLGQRLARVVARRAGGAGAVLARRASTVRAPAGTFTALQYDALQPEEATDHVGAQISLEFAVDAPIEGRIGLIQTISHGGAAWIDAPKKMLGKPVGSELPSVDYVVGQGPVFGALRDPRKKPSARPLSIADVTQPSDVLELWHTGAHDVEVSKEAEEAHAKSYVSKRGKAKLELHGRIQTGERRGDAVTPAALTDRPGFAADQPHASQLVTWTAEAAAVVLDGPWQGTYLGSIRWGWRSEPQEGGLPRVTLTPDAIELVSGFVPSQAFIAAGNRWNESLVEDDSLGSHAIVPVPLPKTVKALDRWDLRARRDSELMSLTKWLLDNWQEVVDKRQLRLLATLLAPVLAEKDILYRADELNRRLRVFAKLESLTSLEELNEPVLV